MCTFPQIPVPGHTWEFGDINSDGFPDLLVAGGWSGESLNERVGTALGRGDGTFYEPRAYEADRWPFAPAVADFNRDSVPDVVTPCHSGGSVVILYGQGGGVLDKRVIIKLGELVYRATVSDWNRDGTLDVLVWGDSGWHALINDGSGAFLPPTVVHSGPPTGILLDLDRDPFLDQILNYEISNGKYSVAIMFGRQGCGPKKGRLFA